LVNFFKKNKGQKLKILFIAAEAAPFASVGGLASVMYSLPKALNRLGHDARVFMPRYVFIDGDKNNLKMEKRELQVPTGSDNTDSKHLICNVKRFDETRDAESPVTTYFLENQEYFELRTNVYGYNDDTIRWALLSRGALEFISYWSDWKPDIIVSSDWQTGLVPNYMKTLYKDDPVISKIVSVFSIHNLFYQAMYDHHFVSEMDYDHGRSEIPAIVGDPRMIKTNPMCRGIMHADYITTVSPNYAKEILTKDYGELLDDLLRERKSVLTGILNGIDYGVWNPATDPAIAARFDVETLDERAKNKVVLQERFGLKADKDAFVLAIVSRLTKQKGLDLLSNIMDTLLRELPIQLIVLGDGESDLMGYFQDLGAKNPGRVGVHLQYDSVLPHVIYAGADALLMPSRFEPCGLAQMEAMRMGTVPIVRKIGGLADSVADYDPSHNAGTGFVFEKFDSMAFLIAIVRAYENFRDKPLWQAIEKRAMEKDFSWDASAKKYSELFTKIVDKKA
jgi:starch synthase